MSEVVFAVLVILVVPALCVSFGLGRLSVCRPLWTPVERHRHIEQYISMGSILSLLWFVFIIIACQGHFSLAFWANLLRHAAIA